MKIKSLSDTLNLHKTSEGLCIQAGDKILASGFSDVGILANRLLPLVYLEEKKFQYIDEESFDVYNVTNVDWISGLHYVGNNLTYMGHNYRTDPIKKPQAAHEFNTNETVKRVFEKFEGCDINLSPEKKFDYDLQKMVETGQVKVACKLSPSLTEQLFNEIKYYRIVGKGVLSKSINLGARPIKLEDGTNYNSRLFSLSQQNDVYGVVDVRSNKAIVEINYNKIDVCPGIIIADSDNQIKY